MDIPAPPPAFTQVYLGASLSAITFDRTVTVNGVKLVDQGGDAFAAGPLLGVQRVLASGLVLGAEASWQAVHGRSRAVVGGVAYSYEPQHVGSMLAIVGWAPGDRRSRLLLMGGVQMWTQSSRTDVVPVVGIGAEIPVFGRGFVRPQVMYAWNQTERYQMTVTMGWRF